MKNYVLMNSQRDKFLRIKILLKNLLEKFKNYRKKSMVCMTQGISEMLNQYAADHCPTFPVHPALFPLPTCPGGLVSRPQNTQPDSWNTHGISGSAFANSPAYSSAPCSRTLNSWEETVAGRIPAHEGAEKPVVGVSDQNRDTISDTEILTKFVSQKLILPKDERNYWNYGADQKRHQFSELHFDRFPYSTNVVVLEDKVQDRSLFLLTFLYGSYAVDQRRRVG